MKTTALRLVAVLAVTVFLASPLVGLAQTGEGFVPLTNIPGLTDTGNSPNLTIFLNNIYRICIGLAAVIAVLQIMRAGVMYMGGDSFSEKKDAKNLIGLSIAGLILVLSPTIIFGIINPDILDLKINKLGDLKTNFSPVTNPYADSLLPEVTAAMCEPYKKEGSQLGYKTVPDGKSCEDVAGRGWAKINGCCASPAPAGQTCCGYSPLNNQNPPTPPQPGDTGTFTYVIYFKDSAYLDDKATKETVCYQREDKTFASLSLCETALNGARSQAPSPGAATGKACLGSNEYATPTPANIWNQLKTLPACPAY